MKKDLNINLVLVDIRSEQNVGSIFRTADAGGVEKIYLVGYTPAPLDQFGREKSGIKKASLGAEKTIAWEKFKNFSSFLKKVSRENVEGNSMLIAIEQDKNSVDYKKVKIQKKSKKIKQTIYLIAGNEVTGLSKSVLNKCDQIAEIPMAGEKESLNVSVAVGIVLFGII